MNKVNDIFNLKEDIQLEYKNVCVFGQGYVGLPLALSFALRGCTTVGVDVNKSLIEEISNGITHHTEKFQGVSIKEILENEIKQGNYTVTTDAECAMKSCNNIIITVGIPIKKGEYIDSDLKNVCEAIGNNLKKNDLVIVRSTVIPGITEELIKPILEEKSGLTAGVDFYLAYSSERIAEGRAFEEFANMDTLVSGINEESYNRASKLLSIVCKARIVKASNIKVVETAKVFENVQRDVNLAMVQEFARFTEALGIDIFEVINLANTHKRVNLLTPGPGVGGYCIPNAYHYLSPKASELNVPMDILKLSRTKNENIPTFICNKVEELLNKSSKNINEAKICVLGIAMKDYSNDDRISPAIDTVKLLIKRGAVVKAYDPAVVTEYDFKVSTQKEAVEKADVILVLAVQENIEFNNFEMFSEMMNKKPIYIDTKNVSQKELAEKNGFLYWKI
ncbi:nucleotide sugar dehydrogenase [Clostridium hydrogenum]|uniref:nucleotide sugar dehydrogenase n=1 Tax=Clostridium hydrogenum TaxID=2855764 RepID=UPI002E2EEA58|nr:nucleotide sugar dehydrogenase [Clostridium hydrogenum]